MQPGGECSNPATVPHGLSYPALKFSKVLSKKSRASQTVSQGRQADDRCRTKHWSASNQAVPGPCYCLDGSSSWAEFALSSPPLSFLSLPFTPLPKPPQLHPAFSAAHCRQGEHGDAEEQGSGAQEARPQGRTAGWCKLGWWWKDQQQAVAPKSLSLHVFDSFAQLSLMCMITGWSLNSACVFWKLVALSFQKIWFEGMKLGLKSTGITVKFNTVSGNARKGKTIVSVRYHFKCWWLNCLKFSSPTSGIKVLAFSCWWLLAILWRV